MSPHNVHQHPDLLLRSNCLDLSHEFRKWLRGHARFIAELEKRRCKNLACDVAAEHQLLDDISGSANLDLTYLYHAIDTGLRSIDFRSLAEAAQMHGADLVPHHPA